MAIEVSTLNFLAGLEMNNNRDWFTSQRKEYEAAKGDMLAFAQKLIDGIGAFDADIKTSALDPKKCLKRINRDIRFSADKSPYKTNFFLHLNAGGSKSPTAGYYFHLKPGESFFGGGVYMPMPNELLQFRTHIHDKASEWQRMIENSDFKNQFNSGIQAPESLQKVPKPFDTNSTVAEYLKMKGYYSVRNLDDELLFSTELLSVVEKGFRAVYPLVRFLNSALIT